ncbi:MAG: hypothetical protein WCS87_07010 [Methylococcaceae bacterium]
MDSKLVAKITVQRTDNNTRTGTAYPVGANLLLTARHVIEFHDKLGKRDETKPVTVDWQDVGEHVVIEPEKINFAFDGGEQLDVVLLCCPLPEAVAKSVNHTILEKEKIKTGNKWETLGFPKVNGFQAQDATGTFGVDQEKPQIRLTLDDNVNEKNFQPDTSGWGGMSGAPVFSTTTNKIQAIIINHNKCMEMQLIGVSVPYLMKLPDFRDALGLTGFSDNSHYIIEQKQQIKDLLNDISDTKLFRELVAKLLLLPEIVTPRVVYDKLCSKFEDDSMEVFDILLQASADTLKQEPSKAMLENIHKLFCLFASLTAPKTLATKEAVIRLFVYTKIATEVYLAAQYNTNPIYLSGQDEISGKYADDASVFNRETGWEVEEFVNEAIKVTALKVLKKDIKNPTNSFERQRLNTTIRQRQNKSLNQLHRFELNCGDEKNKKNPLYDPNYCRALNAPGCLPDLPVVHYGEVGSIEEADLCAKIEEFILLLKKYGYEI